MARRVLVVDDDPQIGQLLCDYLHQHSYSVYLAREGQQMWRYLQDNDVDLVVLDVMLPGEDGVSLCRRLRETSEVPIIMLSAAGEETDRVLGLEMGADDYLAKPFSPRELLARIKALVRRSAGDLAKKRQSSAISPQQNMRFGQWVLDQQRRRLQNQSGVLVPLSAGEHALLLAFLENPFRTLSRDQLMDLTRGREAVPFDRAIDVQVGRLRKKIEQDPKHPEIILTVRGGGYQFNAEVTEEPVK